MADLAKEIDGIMYDPLESLYLDDFCLGRTENGSLWQVMMMTKGRNFFLCIFGLPENEVPSLPIIKDLAKDLEIVAMTEAKAIERFDSKYWDKSPGRFKEYAEQDIEEFLEDSECEQ